MHTQTATTSGTSWMKFISFRLCVRSRASRCLSRTHVFAWIKFYIFIELTAPDTNHRVGWEEEEEKKKSFIISPPLLKSICVHLAITNHPSPLLLCLRIDWLRSIHSRERAALARTRQHLFKQASLQRKEKRSGNCCSHLEEAQGQTGKRPPHRVQRCEPSFGNESGRRCEGLTYWRAVGKWLWSLIGHMGRKEDCNGVYTW